MKCFCRIPRWAASLVIASLWISATLMEADPTDDFSFTLGAGSPKEVYSLLSDEKVAEVLVDRLDLFPKSQAPRLAKHLVQLCKQYRFDPAFVLSLIEVESQFKVRATSPVGALGLMQLMIPTAQFVLDRGIEVTGHEKFDWDKLSLREITPAILVDPFVNTSLGIAYLAWLRDYYEGFLPFHVLAAYNVGPGRLDELLATKDFQPVETKKYFHKIRRGVPDFRFYQRTLARSPLKKSRKKASQAI